MTKTVGCVEFSESRRLVQADKETIQDYPFRAEIPNARASRVSRRSPCCRVKAKGLLEPAEWRFWRNLSGTAGIPRLKEQFFGTGFLLEKRPEQGVREYAGKRSPGHERNPERGGAPN